MHSFSSALSRSFTLFLGTVFLGLAILLSLGIASSPAVAETKRIALTGSSTIAPLISEIAKRYEGAKPGLRIDVQTGGSSRGIADARNGLAEIGMSSRELYPEEKAGLETHLLALDGVAFVVHKDNPIGNLSKKQVLELYTGKFKNWQELGGSDAPITVIDRAQGRSEHEIVADYLGIKSSQIVAQVIAGENLQCVKLIVGNTNAIAFLSVGTAEYEQAHGRPIKLLQLENVSPSSQTVKLGSYPLVRPLILISASKDSSDVKEFIDYALSPSVSDLIKRLSFVPAN